MVRGAGGVCGCGVVRMYYGGGIKKEKNKKKYKIENKKKMKKPLKRFFLFNKR